MSFVLLSSLLITFASANHSWDYDDHTNNVSHWAEDWPECAGEHQSPIEITTDTNTSDACTTPLLLQYACDEDQQFAVRNSGHSVQVIPLEIQHEGGTEISGIEILHHTNDTSIRLQNPFYSTYTSTINSEYCFDSLHFHWGETNEYGSEHSINGQDFPLELHLVHYSCDYHTLSAATKAYADGKVSALTYDDDHVLAVIAVLFEIGEANPVLDLVLNDMILDGVRMYDTEGYINLLSFYYTQFNLNGLLPENRGMFAYEGSLTTPPCYESVRWLVMQETLTVSLEQMAKFRQLLSSTDLDDNMAPNWRPLQDVNGRLIYDCQEMIDAEVVDKGRDDGDVDVVHFDDLIAEIEGAEASWVWAVIGVLIIVTLYLCYLVNCAKEKDKEPERGHGRVKTETQTTMGLGRQVQDPWELEDDESVIFDASA